MRRITGATVPTRMRYRRCQRVGGGLRRRDGPTWQRIPDERTIAVRNAREAGRGGAMGCRGNNLARMPLGGCQRAENGPGRPRIPGSTFFVRNLSFPSMRRYPPYETGESSLAFL